MIITENTDSYTEPSNAQVLSMSIDEVCNYIGHPDCTQQNREDLAQKLSALAKQVGELTPADLVSYHHFSLEEFNGDNSEELNEMYNHYLENERESLCKDGDCESLEEFVTEVFHTSNRNANMFNELVWKVAL